MDSAEEAVKPGKPPLLGRRTVDRIRGDSVKSVATGRHSSTTQELLMKTIPILSAVGAFVLSALLTTPLLAQIKEGAVVDESTGVLEEIMATPEKGIPASLLANAQGIAIVPSVVKGGVGIGIRFGRGNPSGA